MVQNIRSVCHNTVIEVHMKGVGVACVHLYVLHVKWCMCHMYKLVYALHVFVMYTLHIVMVKMYTLFLYHVVQYLWI